MVLGIGEGRIEIKTDKQSYAPNEMIKGEVTLTLNAPKKARELRVLFYGEIQEQHHHHDSHGRSRTSHSIKRVYEQKFTLGGEQEYASGTRTYPFELCVPNIPMLQHGGEGVVSAVTGILANLGDPLANAHWYLDASLDIAMSLDISKKIGINITR